MALREKNFWILLIFLLVGLVIGGFIGELAQKIGGFSWLAYGKSFGLQSPLVLDLSILTITFGFTMRINLASIIGIALSILIYRNI